jgi:MFS family permease
VGTRGALTVIYILTVVGMAFVGVLIPFTGPLARDLGVTPGDLGLAITLFSAPSAVAATLFGVWADRMGYRLGHVVGGLLIAVADLALMPAAGALQLHLAFLLAGTGFAIISAAAPALIMSIVTGRAEARAMAVWATYAPAGLSLGLLLAGVSIFGLGWRAALSVHAALTTGAILACLRLPRAKGEAGGGLAAAWRDWVWAFTDPAVLRLSLAAAVVPAIGYGVTLVAPGVFAAAYGLSATRAAVLMALVNLATLGGSWWAGRLLSGARSPKRLYVIAMAVGAPAQVLVFVPFGGLVAGVVALAVWTTACGVAMAVAMAVLPRVLPNLERAGAAAGLVSQFIAVGSVAAPVTYLSAQAERNGGAVAAVGVALLLASVWLLPSRRGR